MDLSSITAALIAGAAAASTEVASDALKDAYGALKRVLVDSYNFVSTAVLDKKPTSPTSHAAVDEEVKENPALAEDPIVQEKVKQVQDALSAMPPEQLAAAGIDIDYIIAGRDIGAISHSITGKRWEAKRDVTLTTTSSSGAAGKSD
ncbi:hypothetical protein ACC756_27990 [Rhizobium ruizarguesonis]